MKNLLNGFRAFTAFLLFFPLIAFCQPENSGKMENTIFKKNIATVLLFKNGFEMSAPVIGLTSGEKIKLSFDDLDGDLKSYRFTIQHCESDWTLSEDITPGDYIDGLREDNINDFSYSYNTTTRYTHYSALFPTSSMRPKISGNYLIRVFTDDPSDPVLIWRFMVYESTSVTIEGELKQAIEVADRYSRQQVCFNVKLNGMQIASPFQEIKTVITQNDRWDNAITGLKPRFTKSDALDYYWDQGNVFNGGNEFRAFDTKSLITQTERIRKIDYDKYGYEVWLLNDESRAMKNYVKDADINGRRLIKNEEQAKNSDIEADYAWVHFCLPAVATPFQGDVFILGALTAWQANDDSKMDYDSQTRTYIKELFLKQGYYNYMYVVKNKKSGTLDETLIEGNHWETENEYTVWIYYREITGLTDRLIAVQNFSFKK
ncbi:MAG: DUF5103 domain-containing protein [Bacteroidota bacterium]|nr:DUF5103 domain-containing protein [Bacteroidota bacterium]